jgi:outer membrane protein OmpA-like peptidoglycan-associated protein
MRARAILFAVCALAACAGGPEQRPAQRPQAPAAKSVPFDPRTPLPKLDLPAGTTVVEDEIRLPGPIAFKDADDKLDAAQASLAALAETLRKNPRLSRVRVQSHTKLEGTPFGSQHLSERRAKAIADWLTHQGIEAKRIHAVGLGDRSPKVVPKNARDLRALMDPANARVEVYIEGIDGKLAILKMPK